MNTNRRSFIRSTSMVGMGLLGTNISFSQKKPTVPKNKRIGMIGLDTSHSTAFTKAFNDPDPSPALQGYKVVAAYPHGSRDIHSSVVRIPGYTAEVKNMGVEVVDSIKDLLKKVDVVLLLTNDGRLHADQALQVFKAGKPVYIDKPLAASLVDAIGIFEASKHYNIPMFSCSSLRYLTNMKDITENNLIGKILGADTYSPAHFEKTHPDFFWYGIHGIEALYTVMGQGCKTLSRTYTPETDKVVGVWEDNRIGTFRGTRAGKRDFGGMAFGETEIMSLGINPGYIPLLEDVVKFFETGIAPVKQEETLEIFTFMEAADESRLQNGATVKLEDLWKKALNQIKETWK